MKYRRFAPLDRDLSVLVLGTTVYRAAADDVPFELLDAWLELGGNVIDCGREYGESERVLGRWLHQTGCRDDVVLLTKGGHHDAERQRVVPEEITADLLESLAVLQTDAVDIYMLHRDDPSQPVEPILEVLNEHLRAGRIRCFGGSNWRPERLTEANEAARRLGVEAFSCSSPGLSLAQQREPPWLGCVSADDRESRAWYARTGMPVFAWSSQAAGFFVGADNADVRRVYGSDDNRERLRRAAELGRRSGRTANEVALAWVLQQPFPTYAIIGPRTVEELHASIAALEVELTEDERRWLNLEDAADEGAEVPVTAAVDGRKGS